MNGPGISKVRLPFKIWVSRGFVPLISILSCGVLGSHVPTTRWGHLMGSAQAEIINAPARIGANLGAVRYCYKTYPNDENIRSRFKALEQLASEAFLNLSPTSQQIAEKERALTEQSGRHEGKRLTPSQCEVVRENFRKHYR